MVISEPSDRISHLPIEVLDQILGRIPIREAVKTSILSTGWRYKWTEMTKLVFGEDSYPPNCHKLRHHKKLVNFVNCILHRHSDGVITHFGVDDFFQPCSDVDKWILLLSKKMVRNLNLTFGVKRYKVAASLFACETLRSLKLQGCIVQRLPLQFKGFIHLAYLRLYRVKLTNEVLDGLLVKLPALYMLKVQYCDTLTQFRVNAPLTFRSFYFAGVCESINLQNAPNLENLTLRQWSSWTLSRTLACRVDEILQWLYPLREIVIAHPFTEFTSVGTAPKRFEITFHYLVKMDFDVNFDDPKQIVAVLCLCRSSPRLRRLTIKDVHDTKPVLPYDENFWDAQILRKRDVFYCLKSVSIIEFKGAQHQMGFTRFILLKAVKLESFSFKWFESNTMNNETKDSVTNEMMQFKKTSRKARVVSLSAMRNACILLF
ncbi:hypothetical protein ACHQM5_023289 [Ranunculus cassubicifolius]